MKYVFFNSIRTFVTTVLLCQVLSFTFNQHKVANVGSIKHSTQSSSLLHSSVSNEVQELMSSVMKDMSSRFLEIDLRTKKHMEHILKLYKEERIDAQCFHGVDGYGYGDIGREKFDNIIAKLMGAEAALVRLQLFSGTHAISSALFGSLRPNESMLCVSGKPYDTLEEVIGKRVNSQTGTFRGSLKDWGIKYIEMDLLLDEQAKAINNRRVAFDLLMIDKYLDSDPSIKLIHIQRSCGYQWRPSIPVVEIERLCTHINSKYKTEQKRDITIFVDNCYGELVEDKEPCHVGADLCAGSLIKNLGGTLALCGGYIVGRTDLVAAAAVHLSAPGVEGGATLNQYRTMYQGLFLAPSVVGESIKGAELLAEVMQNKLGYECNPPAGDEYRTDIVQAIKLGNKQKVTSFCEVVQAKSPVGSYIKPIPGLTSGYGEEVIFADGTFIDGSTLELSADGPLREPFAVFTQGCTHWTHWALVIEDLLTKKSI